jgi:hypothetical protein
MPERAACTWSKCNRAPNPCFAWCKCPCHVRPEPDQSDRLDQPAATGIDWSRMYHGICPKCGEDKFIGHGPLCVDCYRAPIQWAVPA